MISFEGFSMEDNVPIYLQINRFIKRGIVSGVIRDGEEVPSRRMLSALLGINPNTVQKSYAMLEEEGLLHSRSGAKSCIRVTEKAVGKLKQEILHDQVHAMVVSMKQTGITLEEAKQILTDFWEVEV